MLPLAVSVGDVLAAYAAVVSTIVAATQLIRGRAGVKVLLAPVVAEVESHEYIELWEIRVVNHKPRPITIRDAGLLHEGAQLIDRGPTPLHSSFCDLYARPIESPFPKMLNDGASVEVFVQYGMEPAPKGAWARDELGRQFAASFPSRNPVRRFKDWRRRRKIERLFGTRGRD